MTARGTGAGTGAPSRAALADGSGVVDRAWLRWLDGLAHGVRDAAPQVGDLVVSLAPDRGPGWLRCDGASYRRAEYPVLAALLEPAPVPPDRDTFGVPDIPEGPAGRSFIRAR